MFTTSLPHPHCGSLCSAAVMNIFLWACLAFVTCCASDDGIIIVNPITNKLEDQFGRERLFHGVNAINKNFPYFPITGPFDFQMSLGNEDLELLQEWGMNVVRLGVMWPGAEPATDIVEELIANMSTYGIYALIDVHQDLFSEKFCGEGVPLWAAQPANDSALELFPIPIDLPYQTDALGIPLPSECAKRTWGAYYPTVATSTAFQRLYDNYDNLLDSFAAYWQKIASILVKYDNVIGYELINEPWAGDIFSKPDLLIPEVADKENLAPMYEVLHTAIRQVDDKHLVFFESVTWDDLKVGFDNVPGGDNYKNRSVLSYHIYIPPDITIAEAFHARKSDILRLGCGGVLTEFEVCQSGQNLSDILTTIDLADVYLQSWIVWEYKIFVKSTGGGYCMFGTDGDILGPLLSMLSRTYPLAVAGQTHSIAYVDSTKQFTLQYEMSDSISQPTVIYLNEKVNYPNGYSVTVSPANIASWNSSHNNVFVWNTKAQSLNVTVAIKSN